MHQRTDPLLTGATDVEILSHPLNTDESSDVTRNENCVGQSQGFLLLNRKAGSDDLSVSVGTGLRPIPSLFDVGKSATCAAAYAVAKGILSQFQDSAKQDNNLTNLGECDPLLSRTTSSSSSEEIISNSLSTEQVNKLPPIRLSGIGISSFHVSSILNQHSSSRDENFVSRNSFIPRSPTPQDPVLPNSNNSNCETVAEEPYLSQLPTSTEAIADDLPTLLCSFLFGSPDSATSCDTVLTTLEEDPQTRSKNGSMDFILSPSTSENTQLQILDSEPPSCETLGASPYKSDAESVSVSGDEFRTKETEKHVERGSKVHEFCISEEVSSTTNSAPAEKTRRTRTKCRVSRRNSNVKEVQREISEESGYQTCSENNVTLGMETTDSSEKTDKGESKDDEEEDDDVDKGLVLVPSGEYVYKKGSFAWNINVNIFRPVALLSETIRI